MKPGIYLVVIGLGLLIAAAGVITGIYGLPESLAPLVLAALVVGIIMALVGVARVIATRLS